MKIKVANLTSGPLALPSPLVMTLAGGGAGKSAIVSVSDADWRTMQTSPSFAKLVRARQLSMAPIVDVAPVEAVEAVAKIVEAVRDAPVNPGLVAIGEAMAGYIKDQIAPASESTVIVKSDSQDWEPTPAELDTVVTAFTAAQEADVASEPVASEPEATPAETASETVAEAPADQPVEENRVEKRRKKKL
jgi:hypothetical protein